jgi:hypothetical protein
MVNKTKNKFYPQFSHNHKRGSCSSNRFFSRNKIVGIVAIIILIVVSISIYPPTKKAQAAGLSSVVTTLSSTVADAESKIGVVFTPGAQLTDNETILVYIGEASGDDPWTDDDVTIDATDVTCAQGATNFDGKIQTDATATTPVTFGCTVNGAGEAGAVTVELGNGAGDDMYNPAGADIYTTVVVTTDDSGAGVVYVGDANKVDVSVTVLPNLSMLLDNAGVGCSGTPVVTCALGTVLTTTVVTGNYDINVGTNGTGATVQIADDGDLGTIDDFVEDSGVVTAGTEEYGLELSVDGAWALQGNYSDNDTPIAGGATDLAIIGAAIAEDGNDITVTHRVAVDSTTAAGSHSHTVTYTVTATF